MSNARDRVIRCHFEAHRDLTWFEDLAPRFRDQGVCGNELQEYRERWNRDADQRHWPQWRIDVAEYSDQRLENMIMDCVERMGVLGVL